MSNTRTIIGIDPGKSGGIARLAAFSESVIPMPATERDVWESLQSLIDVTCCAVIEKVASRPGQGVASMFNFGRNYGMLRGMLIALQIPIHEITPQKWQKELGLGQKFASTTERKNAHKARAQELFPRLKVTHATADAILIAEAFRRQQTSQK